jgi:hypothetical protein
MPFSRESISRIVRIKQETEREEKHPADSSRRGFIGNFL